MTAEEMLASVDRMHRAGLGITMNTWAEDDDVAVLAWRDGKPFAHANAPTMLEAFARLAESVES